jgi:signal transduction histidine kinase
LKTPSLSTRITLLLIITSLLVLGSGAQLMDWRIDHEMSARFGENLLTQAQALTSVIEFEQEDTLARPRLPRIGPFAAAGRAWYEIRCEGLPPQDSTPAPPVKPDNWPEAAGGEPRFQELEHAGSPLGSVMFTFRAPTADNDPYDGKTPPGHDCRLLFEQDRRPFDQMLLAIDWILVLGPALALGIALLAVPLIVRRGLRPVGALAERMRAIGPNAPGERLTRSGLRELDPLVDRFNDVLARMDEGLARERQFASGLAHETRTRLAELRALAEVEARYPSGRALPEILAEVGHIGAELEATVSALLLLTRLQAGVEPPQRQLLELKPWLDRQVQRQHALAARRGVTLRCEGSAPEHLHSDPALLEVIVGNLLGNACAYAPPGDTVCVRLDHTGLAIDNAARELEPADLGSFGERFWRKQSPHDGHAGLGLALARAAADVLGMPLAFHLSEQRLHARLRWPLDLPSPPG